MAQTADCTKPDSGGQVFRLQCVVHYPATSKLTYQVLFGITSALDNGPTDGTL
jgi:hypothetical protein